MKILTSISLLASTALILASCGNANKSENKSGDSTTVTVLPLTQLTSNTETSNLHLYFTLKELNQTDSSVVYAAQSLANNDTVGLQVEVIKNIAPGLKADGTADEENGFRKGAIKISSLGEESDNFVKSLGALMKLPTDGKMTSQTLLPTIFSSNKNTVDLSKASTYAFKYFFENGTGKEAEMFGVVDTYKKSFELTEKDSTFRAAILSTFEGK